MSETPEKPKTIHDYGGDWKEGDFTLVSSDGFRFKVSSEKLFKAR